MGSLLAEAKAGARSLASTLLHMTFDVGHFGVYWLALFVVRAIEHRFPVNGVYAHYVVSLHGWGVVGAAGWTTLSLLLKMIAAQMGAVRVAKRCDAEPSD